MEKGKHDKSWVKDVSGLITEVERCAKKVALVREFICPRRLRDEPPTDDEMAGLYFVLNDLEDDLNFVVNYYHELRSSATGEETASGEAGPR